MLFFGCTVQGGIISCTQQAFTYSGNLINPFMRVTKIGREVEGGGEGVSECVTQSDVCGCTPHRVGFYVPNQMTRHLATCRCRRLWVVEYGRDCVSDVSGERVRMIEGIHRTQGSHLKRVIVTPAVYPRLIEFLSLFFSLWPIEFPLFQSGKLNGSGRIIVIYTLFITKCK